MQIFFELLVLRVSSTQSDVWSYGVVLWEIFTLGESPHRGVSVEVFLSSLHAGRTSLPQPPSCPDAAYALMQRCWQFSPDDRPHWGDIVQNMANLMNSKSRGTV